MAELVEVVHVAGPLNARLLWMRYSGLIPA
jgi:hypothetical protein